MSFTFTTLFVQIEDFVRHKGDLGSATKAFARAKDVTRGNIDTLQTFGETLSKWLEERVSQGAQLP